MYLKRLFSPIKFGNKYNVSERLRMGKGMKRMKLRRYWLYLVLFLFIASGVGLTQAQGDATIRITQVDTSAFPEMRVNVLAAAGDGSPLADLSSIQLSENGTIITDIQTSSAAVGIEVAFVIDANSTINQRDTGANQSRREQVRDSIVAFAQQNMSSSQLDRVHIVVPNAASDSPEFLTETSGAIFANEVINKINFYVPNAPKATPLNDMLTAAIEKLSTSEGSRYQAIVLYTDGGLLNNQLDFDALIAQAQQNHIVFYAFILGSRADTNEINNVNALTEPTGGAYLHMPLPADAAPLFQSLAAFGQQTVVIYRSALSSSGEHPIVVNVAGQTSESFVNVTVESPTVQILLDNSQPIIRVASATDTPLADMEPLSQLIVAQVSWPDSHARSLAAATLLINGTEQAVIESPTVDANNLLEFTWDISQLDAGEYELVIQIQDELNLISQSEPLAFRVEIERPTLETAPTDTTTDTTTNSEVATVDEATQEGEETTSVLSENVGLIGIIIGILAIGFALFLVILAFIFLRRRNATPPPVPAPASMTPMSMSPDAMSADATQILMPAFAAAQTPTVTLEALEYANEHTQPIALSGNDITIGRDPAHAKIILQDKSVSRLHARIRLDRGNYVLVDEGSASGTYVNFERVGFTPQVLRNNDEIHIGRVRLRFKLAESKAAMDDRTQVFDAPRGGRVAPPPQSDDNMNTEYFQQQPNAGAAPRQSPSAPSGSKPPGADPDDVSTQPFMPHQPKR